MESNEEGVEINYKLEILVEARSKCGEIFVTKTGHISCYCLMCQQDYENFVAFSNHVLEDHLKLDYLNDVGDFCNKTNVGSVFTNEEGTNYVHINIDNIKTEPSCESSESHELKAKEINYNIKLLNNFDCSHQENEKEYVTKSENSLESKIYTEFNVPIQSKNFKRYTCKLCEQHLTNTEISQNRKINHSFDITDFLYCEKCIQELPIYKSYKIKHDGERQVPHTRDGTCFKENSDIYGKISNAKGNSRESEVLLKRNKDYKFFSLIKDKNINVKGINYCEICAKHFISQKEYENHILSFHDSNIAENFLTIIPKKCSYCPRNFQKKINLEKHEERHKKVEVCEYCGKLFANQNAKYQQHLRSHTGEKPFVCSICSNAFSTRGNLNHHKSTAHCEERPYICTWENCGKGFKKDRQRVWHERTHTGEKPYQCEQCGEHFAFQHKLSLHKKQKHLDKKDRPHKCDLCEKAFVLPRQLREHKYTHTGEKPHQCDICPARFAKRGALTEHKKLHTGEKKHVCEICGRAFAQRAGYATHIKSHSFI